MRVAGCGPNVAVWPWPLFKSKRGLQVQTLGARMADAQVALESLQYRDERAKVRESLRRGQAHLARWEQAQPLQDNRHVLRMRPVGLAYAWDHLQPRRYERHRWACICPAWPRWAKDEAGSSRGCMASTSQPAKTATATIAPADRRTRPGRAPRIGHRPADHHPHQPPRRSGAPRKRPALGNLASAHTTRTSEPMTGATVGATTVNDYSSFRIELNAGPASCREDEPDRTVSGPIWVPTDQKVGVRVPPSTLDIGRSGATLRA